jgi:hypothetical protein
LTSKTSFEANFDAFGKTLLQFELSKNEFYLGLQIPESVQEKFS